MNKQLHAAALAASLLAGCGGGGGASGPLPGVAAPTVPTSVSVAGIGDSITAGYVDPTGVTYFTDAAHSYVGLAAAQIGATLTDPAVPGEPCAWMITNEVPSIPANTTFVVLNCGANELRQGNSTAFSDFDAVVAAIRSQAPHARLVIVDERDLASAPGGENVTTPMVTAWNAHEQSVAASVGAVFIDIQNNAQVYGANWPDGLHPDAKGAAALAQMVVAAL